MSPEEGLDRDAFQFEAVACSCNDRERTRVVAMNAQRFSVNRHARSIDGFNAAVLRDAERLVSSGARVVDQGARPVARNERTVGHVRAVDERFASDCQSRPARLVDEPSPERASTTSSPLTALTASTIA